MPCEDRPPLFHPNGNVVGRAGMPLELVPSSEEFAMAVNICCLSLVDAMGNSGRHGVGALGTGILLKLVSKINPTL